VLAHYAGAPAIEWGTTDAAASVLRIDFSLEHGIRVEPRLLAG
jgi:hypothetical protein